MSHSKRELLSFRAFRTVPASSLVLYVLMILGQIQADLQNDIRSGRWRMFASRARPRRSYGARSRTRAFARRRNTKAASCQLRFRRTGDVFFGGNGARSPASVSARWRSTNNRPTSATLSQIVFFWFSEGMERGVRRLL